MSFHTSQPLMIFTSGTFPFCENKSLPGTLPGLPRIRDLGDAVRRVLVRHQTYCTLRNPEPWRVIYRRLSIEDGYLSQRLPVAR